MTGISDIKAEEKSMQQRDYHDDLGHEHGDKLLKQVADKIINQLENPITLSCYEMSISASVGIAIYPDDASDVRQLIQASNSAMYAANKDGGGNCFCSSTNR